MFAKKHIPKRFQFGPVEGILCDTYGVNLDDNADLLHLLIQSKGGIHRLDVSNEGKVCVSGCFVYKVSKKRF